MEVLLLKDVPKLGQAGDGVRVSDGYARNFLIPRQLAVPMDEGARKQAEGIRAARKRQVEKEQRDAQALAARLDGLTVTFTARAGEQGKLYGSVTASDIAEEINRQHEIEVDRRRLVIEEPIRELGTHPVEIRISQSAVAHVSVVVEAAQED